MHDVASLSSPEAALLLVCVRSKDAQKQVALTSLTARSKLFAICYLNNRISPHKDHKILRAEQIVSTISWPGTQRGALTDLVYPKRQSFVNERSFKQDKVTTQSSEPLNSV